MCCITLELMSTGLNFLIFIEGNSRCQSVSCCLHGNLEKCSSLTDELFEPRITGDDTPLVQCELLTVDSLKVYQTSPM